MYRLSQGLPNRIQRSDLTTKSIHDFLEAASMSAWPLNVMRKSLGARTDHKACKRSVYI